jgi:hypothetical protein
MRRVAFAVALCVVSACASTSGSTSESGPARNSDVITTDELALPEIAGGDAYQAVQRLRPRFLISRGMTSANSPSAGAVHVSMDGAPLESVDFLKRIRLATVKEIRYLNATDAAQRFGTAAGMGGVIVVINK